MATGSSERPGEGSARLGELPWGRELADMWRGACRPHRPGPVLLPLPCWAAARPWGSRWGLAGRVQPDGRWMRTESSCISPSIPHEGLPVSTLFPQDRPGKDSGSRSSICWTSGRPAPACPDSWGNEHAQSPGPCRLHAEHEGLGGEGLHFAGTIQVRRGHPGLSWPSPHDWSSDTKGRHGHRCTEQRLPDSGSEGVAWSHGTPRTTRNP